MTKMSSEEIAAMFDAMEETHGEDKSTEFLLSVTASACNCDDGEVANALYKHRRNSQ